MPAIYVSGREAFCFADINLHLSAAIINAVCAGSSDNIEEEWQP